MRRVKPFLNDEKIQDFKYNVHLSRQGRRLLPSDEALKGVIAHTPYLSFVNCVRFPDHDYLVVRGEEKNPLRTTASPRQRAIGKKFLRQIENVTLAERDIRPDIRIAAQQLMQECVFVRVQWDGSGALAHDKDGKRYVNRPARDGGFGDQLKSFERLCADEIPFFYGTAL